LVTGKNRMILFDRPKPTAGCSANGRRRRFLSDATDNSHLQGNTEKQ
jgi:hypothetical protein